MLRRLSILLGAGALVLAIGAGPALAGSAQSAYVTESQDCIYPIDLKVNQLGDLSDAYVWLKRVTEAQVEDDLVWSLWQGGVQVGDGTFDFICTTGDGKYTLVYPDFESSEGQDGTFTVKVDCSRSAARTTRATASRLSRERVLAAPEISRTPRPLPGEALTAMLDRAASPSAAE